ncbi:MAG: hypothetical protein Q8O89_00365 [Nanoarchaeota archaeon]|nr:hypothetical protein [Nanoarchaeota archaeon]
MKDKSTKALVVYYSRSGVTKKLGSAIADSLVCDEEEIIDLKNRDGAIGYVLSGRDATLRKLADIRHMSYDVDDYDLIIMGTPIWAFNMCPAVRTFLTNNKDKFNGSKGGSKKLAFFCTMGGSGDEKTFDEMESLSGKTPVAVIALKTKEVISDKFSKQVEDFVSKLKKN